MIKAAQTFIFFILFAIFNLLFTIPAYAQERQDLHSYTQNVMIEVMSALTCQLAGVDSINPSQKCLGINNGKIGPVDTSGGAIGAMGNLIAMTFTPPAHTEDYVKYLAGNFGISKPAYAQGIGFTGLSPLTNVWVAFRNIVYLLFVLVFVIIGFAIMLRVRIDPRTVMTIENQIPKIIIALILVTFSFAIAGFLIDLMYVFIYLSINVFNSIDIPGIKGSIAPAFSDIQGRTALEVANNIKLSTSPGIFGQGTDGIIGIVTKASDAVSKLVASLVAGEGTILGTLSNIPVIGGVGGAIISTLAFVIILIAVLWALFRLWFTLIMAYIFILIDVVFAPFWIIAGLMPGSGLTIGNWLRHIVAYLAAFPATVIMFMLGKVFIDGFAAAQGFFPPLIGNPGGANIVGAMVALGIILTTPTVVNMMVNALKAPKFDLAPIGQAIGVGAGYPVSVTRQIGSIAVGRGEAVINPDTGVWERRGLRTAFLGRIFGR